MHGYENRHDLEGLTDFDLFTDEHAQQAYDDERGILLTEYLTAHSAEVYNNNPRDFLNSVNEGVTGRINSGFVTGLAGHFGTRQEDGSRQLILAHAGHKQVLIYRKKKDIIERRTDPPRSEYTPPPFPHGAHSRPTSQI